MDGDSYLLVDCGLLFKPQIVFLSVLSSVPDVITELGDTAVKLPAPFAEKQAVNPETD